MLLAALVIKFFYYCIHLDGEVSVAHADIDEMLTGIRMGEGQFPPTTVSRV